jgi:phosphohistidine phosphatase
VRGPNVVAGIGDPMDVASRKLLVVRHAKSAWPVGVPDSLRPLGPRGLRDAPRMGQRIRELVGTVDLVVVSPTQRTQQTWALMNEELGHGGPVVTDPRVYDAWGAHMLDLVRDLPADAHTVMILGHEPGVSELVLSLAGSAEDDLRDLVATKFPTCAVALLGADRPWVDFAPGCAALETFTTPKD